MLAKPMIYKQIIFSVARPCLERGMHNVRWATLSSWQPGGTQDMSC